MTDKRKKRILIFGATGMLGSTIFRSYSDEPHFETFGTIRNPTDAHLFDPQLNDSLIPNVYLEGEAGIMEAFSVSQPDVVINCVGIIKQQSRAKDHLQSLEINSRLPHRLAKYCSMVGARLIHFSTDCVFSGTDGRYTEDDFPDARDLYGRTKYLGEVSYENAITLRTSIVGHELTSNNSLVDWFLSQSGEIKGFKKAIFSGLPTIEVARVVSEFVIPNSELHGVYHLSVNPISKYDLLRLVAKIYEKHIKIVPDDQISIDRSLNSERFRAATGFSPKPWSELIEDMYKTYRSASATGS